MAIKNSSIFLVIVSKASQGSVWIEKELDSAINARKKIIPVRIDDEPLSDMYTFYMNNIQMIDVQIQVNGRISKSSLEKLYTKFKESIPKQSVISKTMQEREVVSSSVGMIEKTDVQNEIERRKIDTRTNTFRINKIPVHCEQCGMKLEYVNVGTYRCIACNIDYYDDFMKIRNYIRDNGPAPAYMIAKSTGVSKQTIEYYFRDDVKISSKEMDFVQMCVTKKGRQMAVDSAGTWRSSLWKK